MAANPIKIPGPESLT